MANDFYDREFNKYDSIAYGHSRDIAGIYDHEKPLHLMLDALFYYPQETSGYGSTFWPNGVQEHDDLSNNSQALDGDEERQPPPPNNGGSNWLSEYGWSICGGWGEDFQICGYGGGLEKADDDSYRGGEECTTYDSYCDKEKEKQSALAYDDYSPWFGCGAVEDFYESNCQEPNPKLTHDFPDEFGIYHGIFGYYLPCLLQKNYGEQEAYDYGNQWK